MDATAYQKAEAEALMPANELTLWSVLLDPTFFVLLAVLLLSVAAALWHPSSRRFVRKQTEYLDHQRDVNEKALEQNRSFEQIISRQYSETNTRADRALAQGEEAVRLHAQALEQLKGMNVAIARLNELLEQQRGGRPA